MRTWVTIEPEDVFNPAHAGITAAALMDKTFPSINYIVPGYVCEGLTVLAGAPKLGKSWLTLGWALAIASETPAFGTIPVMGGDVLYLALEDNQRRLKARLLHMGTRSRMRERSGEPPHPHVGRGGGAGNRAD